MCTIITEMDKVTERYFYYHIANARYCVIEDFANCLHMKPYNHLAVNEVLLQYPLYYFCNNQYSICNNSWLRKMAAVQEVFDYTA